MCVVILCAVTQILERLQWLFAHKLDTLSYRFVGCLTILYQLSGLFGFVGNGIAIVNMQVNPEFSAEMLVHLLGVHEGLQYQKSSKKRLSSLSFFFYEFPQSLSLHFDVASHMESQPSLFHILAVYYSLMTSRFESAVFTVR